FMGNEFGDPEWIDFPREGNKWSYKYARRQWELADRDDLKYKYLGAFDNDMIHLLSSIKNFQALPINKLWDNDGDQILAFGRGEYIFIFNFNPVKSFADYGILAPEGKYETVLDSDSKKYGGMGNVDDSVAHFTQHDALYAQDGKGWLKIYIPARTAIVLRREQ
ncbi:MAG: alpha amylase C-terminal domain-containing protein, partial [Muribaculaceae bacterium]|nr:alpha amylase C-terminal domain-containing protein [Muribaculaceae bacterium]